MLVSWSLWVNWRDMDFRCPVAKIYNFSMLYRQNSHFSTSNLWNSYFFTSDRWNSFFSHPVDEIHIFTCLIDELLHLFDLIIFLFYRFSKFSIFICKISNSENFESIDIDGFCQPIDEISEFFMNNWWNSWFFSMSNWRVLLFVS